MANRKDKDIIELLNYVSKNYSKKYEDLNGIIDSNDDVIKSIVETIPEKIINILRNDKNRYEVRGSAGKGRMNKAPWIGVFDKNVTCNPQEGVYVVLFLNTIDKCWCLTLNQGVTSIRRNTTGGNKAVIKKLEENIKEYRNKIKEIINDDKIYNEYTQETSIGKSEYDTSCILSKKFKFDNIEKASFLESLKFLVDIYSELFTRPDIDLYPEKSDSFLLTKVASYIKLNDFKNNDNNAGNVSIAAKRIETIKKNTLGDFIEICECETKTIKYRSNYSYSYSYVDDVNSDKPKIVVEKELRDEEKLFEIIRLLGYIVFCTRIDIKFIDEKYKNEFEKYRRSFQIRYNSVVKEETKKLLYNPELEKKLISFIYPLLIPIDKYQKYTQDVTSDNKNVNQIIKSFGVSYLDLSYYEDIILNLSKDLEMEAEDFVEASKIIGKPNSDYDLLMFISIDIVNSSLYKANHVNSWANDLSSLMNYIDSKLHFFVRPAKLWRSIGDELVYTVSIKSVDMLKNVFEYFVRSYYAMINDIKNKFELCDIDQLKNQSNIVELGLKATSWLALVKDVKLLNRDSSPKDYENIIKQYETFDNAEAIEYLGIDIDTGFRISKYTYSNQIALSFELAYLLNVLNVFKNIKSPKTSEQRNTDDAYIVRYEQLKGVWPSHYYPIIWYYNKKMNFDQDFKDVIDYDAKIKNEIIKEYEEVVSNNISTCQKDLAKIKKDLKLGEKIKAMGLSIGIIMRGE